MFTSYHLLLGHWLHPSHLYFLMNGDSYRRRAAAGRQSAKHDAGATTSSDKLVAKTSDNIMEDTTD